jgi:hypothetical protein
MHHNPFLNIYKEVLTVTPPVLKHFSIRWQTGQTGVFRNPFSAWAFEVGRMIEMRTRGNPSGPEAAKASLTGRIYGSNCVD